MPRRLLLQLRRHQTHGGQPDRPTYERYKQQIMFANTKQKML
jgi:hypothetical protein